MKLKLTGSGFEKYTGQLGILYFKDGLSTTDVLPTDALRIAGSIGAIWEDGQPANVGDVYAQSRHLQANNDDVTLRADPMAVAIMGEAADKAVERSNKIAQAQFEAEGISMPAFKKATPQPKDDAKEPEKPKQEDSSAELKAFTRVELEEIADKEGLAGLRKIADERGVKGKSINAIIDQLLMTGE